MGTAGPGRAVPGRSPSKPGEQGRSTQPRSTLASAPSAPIQVRNPQRRGPQDGVRILPSWLPLALGTLAASFLLPAVPVSSHGPLSITGCPPELVPWLCQCRRDLGSPASWPICPQSLTPVSWPLPQQEGDRGDSGPSQWPCKARAGVPGAPWWGHTPQGQSDRKEAASQVAQVRGLGSDQDGPSCAQAPAHLQIHGCPVSAGGRTLGTGSWTASQPG